MSNGASASGSKQDLVLAKAKPISNGGSTSEIKSLRRRGMENCSGIEE